MLGVRRSRWRTDWYMAMLLIGVVSGGVGYLFIDNALLRWLSLLGMAIGGGGAELMWWWKIGKADK